MGGYHLRCVCTSFEYLLIENTRDGRTRMVSLSLSLSAGEQSSVNRAVRFVSFFPSLF